MARRSIPAGLCAAAAALAGPALARDTLGVVPVMLSVEPSCRVSAALVKTAARVAPRIAVNCNAEMPHVATVIAVPPPAKAALRPASRTSAASPARPAIVQIDF